MIPPSWRDWRRILAIRLDNVGDVIMTGPALRSLKETIPRAEITLMSSPAGAQAAALLPWVDAVLIHRAIWQETRPTITIGQPDDRGLIERLAAERFDAAFIFTSFSQTPHGAAYACYLAGIPVRIGESKEFGGQLLTHAASPRPDSVHQADRNLGLLEAVSIPVRSRSLEIRVPQESLASGKRLLDGKGMGGGQPYFVLAPGASCSARRYSYERFTAAALGIAAVTGWKPVLVGNQRDLRHRGQTVTHQNDGVIDLAGRTSLSELAAVISGARLVLTNNSGPLHLADALGVPTTVMYSGTDLEEQWRPRATANIVLRRPTPCSPCYRFECPYNLECLDIPPDEVVARSLELLDRRAAA